MMDWLAALGAVTAILWTGLPLLRSDAWWIRAFEFPRIQVTGLTVIVLVAYVVVAGWQRPRDVVLLLLLAACVAFQLQRIAPYTRLHRTQVPPAVAPDPAETLGLLVANVLTPNRRAAELLSMIRAADPDVVLAVETDAWWEAQLDELEPDYPYTIKQPLDNLYGMHLYSRLELVEPEVLFLVEDDVPSMHANVVLRSGHRVELHCVHPAPPSPTENPTSAERDAELLIVGRSLQGRARSVVVMGDLNDVAWSATTRLFQRMSGLLDPRVGRGLYNTFHARYPLVRWPLDHVFVSADFTLVSLARLADFGSDHFPIHTVLHRTGAASEERAQSRADADERARAQEKIDEVDADETSMDQVNRRLERS